ncbi:hypothetical protein EG68_06933 [Paragonimus skrjabini miyazakii]|uniref:Uncharacterized protein n=1 Tax=Paragonimus skrjabini miyazakii TaxID=59628 RepID=A0A8S9YMA1_9TREM|nr:hypothetical protein EG68_06933 [Paragonimus skrjabini miyazakii]
MVINWRGPTGMVAAEWDFVIDASRYRVNWSIPVQMYGFPSAQTFVHPRMYFQDASGPSSSWRCDLTFGSPAYKLCYTTHKRICILNNTPNLFRLNSVDDFTNCNDHKSMIEVRSQHYISLFM